MFKAVIISESLKHPSWLNDCKKLDVYVHEYAETPEAPIWHLFKVEVPDEQVEPARRAVEENIKYGWYAHFFNGEIVHVCFEGRSFTIPQEENWSSPEFQTMKDYAVSHGVEEKYLDIDTRP